MIDAAPRRSEMGRMRMDVLDANDYLERLLVAPRPGMENVLAFLDYRVGAVCKNPKFLLIPLDDHLCHRGDGVFETVAYRSGRALLFDAHLERLRDSASALRLAPPCPWEEVRALTLEVARAGGADQGALRILLGRGPGGFGISPAECPTSSLYIIAMTSSDLPEEVYAKGFSACRSSVPARQSYLARIKTTNYLPNVLMTDEASRRGFDIPLSFDDNGDLAESAIANVALVDAQGVFAAPALTHALPGTTLIKAFELIEQHMPVSRRAVREEEIYAAREFLLFGTPSGCVPITSYEGRPIGDGRPGPVAELLRRSLREVLLREGTPL
ncbi:MAG: aminotransferase class IV [Deltaproteobacteria bacterium]|jgi:branched-chain amino acid aminotransferase|nr:aminotransferase class IV [Deltaproteobacteria bacterium]